MHESWKDLLAEEFGEAYFKRLVAFVREERADHVVFPPARDVFNALSLPFEDVKVVIVGQDPYHNHGQAHGLCFSVNKPMKPPPSLANIFQELEADVPGFTRPDHGCLQAWADQGVLLLNTVLTVRAHEAGSHQGKGWELLTMHILGLLGVRDKPVVVILWGRKAQDAARVVLTGERGAHQEPHVVIKSAHPSPFSATSGFFGSRPFSQTNQALEAMGLKPIDWRL